MTGITAEKRDSFLSPNVGRPVKGEGAKSRAARRLEFSLGRHALHLRGAHGIRPGSNEPHRALSSTPTRTLVIPTAFVSWTGEALDQKTRLLEAVLQAGGPHPEAVRLQGRPRARDLQQELFLIDRQILFHAPRHLINTGATLFQRQAAREGQEMEDHYFGSIPERVLCYMHDVERELLIASACR